MSATATASTRLEVQRSPRYRAERLPATLRALCAGELTLSKARVVLEETANLGIAQCARLEPELIALAAGRTPGSLRRIARARVEKVDADAATKRAKAARAGRRVEIWPEADGMYALRAILPAEEAIAVFGVIDSLAHANRVPGEEFGIDALRADAFVDLVLNPGAQPPRVSYKRLRREEREQASLRACSRSRAD
jgi:hypothetical protein